MKVLLINPPIDHIVKSTVPDYVNYQLKSSPMPPLGLMYLAAYIEQHGHKVEILDMALDDWKFAFQKLYALNKCFEPDVIGITVTTLTLYDARYVAEYCKNTFNNITTIAGGAHCGIYPEETKSLSCFDYIVIGDGEVSLLNILNSIDSNNSNYIDSINTIEDLDSLPFPARHLIDNKRYHSAMSKSKLVTSMITSRGCPYSCTFCHQPHYGKKWRARSAWNVVKEMEEIVSNGIHEIEIYDDTFTYDKDRVFEICRLILGKYLDKKVSWSIRTRVDKVDKWMLKAMSLAGCKRINYGIESANNRTLKTLRKGFTVEQSRQAIEWTRQAGIEIQAYFMIGSPNETKEQILDTIEFANKYIPDYAYYSITSPCPGTPLYEQGLKEGRYNDYWRDFAINPVPDFNARYWGDLSRDELFKYMEYGFKSFYRRPWYILRQLVRTRTYSELVRKSKMAVRMLK